MHKITEKFKQVVVFGTPDLPHNKRQHLLARYNISVQMIFAKDFPVNFAVQTQNETVIEAIAAAESSAGLFNGAAAESHHSR